MLILSEAVAVVMLYAWSHIQDPQAMFFLCSTSALYAIQDQAHLDCEYKMSSLSERH